MALARSGIVAEGPVVRFVSYDPLSAAQLQVLGSTFGPDHETCAECGANNYRRPWHHKIGCRSGLDSFERAAALPGGSDAALARRFEWAIGCVNPVLGPYPVPGPYRPDDELPEGWVVYRRTVTEWEIDP